MSSCIAFYLTFQLLKFLDLKNDFFRNLDIKVPTKLTEMLECTIAGLELQKLVIDGACESNAHIVNRAKAW